MGEYTSKMPSVNVGTLLRPTILRIPNGWKPDKAYPIVCCGHNFDAASGNEAVDSAGLDVRGRLDFAQCGSFDDGWFSIVPNGFLDADNHKTWNASAACCDTHATGTDDQLYWETIIGNVRALGWNIDWNRLYWIGYSAGAFMGQRMACHRPDLICGLASFSGAFPTLDGSGCAATKNVSVLIIHGTLDTTVPYPGGIGNPPVSQEIPSTAVCSAAQSARFFANLSGAPAGTPVPYGSPINLVTTGSPVGAGAETTRAAFAGTPADGCVEQWDMNSVPHSIGSVFAGAGQIIATWLMARPRLSA